MRKRSDLSAGGLPLALDPSLRLELWLARSRSPLYQRILQKAAFERDQNSGYDAPLPPQQQMVQQ